MTCTCVTSHLINKRN